MKFRINVNQMEAPATAHAWRRRVVDGFVHDAWQTRVESAEVLESEKNHVGLHWTPGASLLRFYTRRFFEAQINKRIRVFSGGNPAPKWADFTMDQSVAICETLEHEENCAIVSFWYLGYQNLGFSQVQLN